MTHYRLESAPDRLTLVDEGGIRTSVADALRAGKVTIEFEQNMRFLDGHHGPLYYLRLSPRMVGGHFCAPLSRRQAEDLARTSGVEILRFATPIVAHTETGPRRSAPIEMTVGRFASLPILETLADDTPDGMCARAADALRHVSVRRNGAWIEQDVVLT